MVERTKVDFSVSDNRSWFDAMDELALRATPQIFEWLKWIIILVALQVAGNKTNDAVIKFITSMLYVYIFYISMLFVTQSNFDSHYSNPRGKSGLYQLSSLCCLLLVCIMLLLI